MIDAGRPRSVTGKAQGRASSYTYFTGRSAIRAQRNLPMKNLIEVGKIVTKKKVRKIEIFDDHSLRTKNSKFNEFYEALMADKFKNDRDAATFLYGCSPTDDKYRQLKSRFRKRLLNTLFFLDVNLPATSSYDRAY